MADETKQDQGPWPFELLRRYDEVGPGLGRLYEARNAQTGSPALVFFPGDRVEWQPEGPWRAQLLYQPEPVCLTLDLEQAPESTDATDVVDSLVLMTAASQRAEDNPRFATHFARKLERRDGGWSARRALAGLTVFALGFGGGCLLEGVRGHHSSRDVSKEEAPVYFNQREAGSAAISYPMPEKPFKSQALPPCNTSEMQVEINGGCWLELALKPPCSANYADHQGKCYIPVHKKEPLPQSNQP